MNGNIVAQRYAHALFAVGKEEGLSKLESYGESLSALAGMLNEAPELARLFRAPVINVAEKQAVIRTLLSRINAEPVVERFCLLLADKDRLPLFGDVVACFSALLDQAKGIVRGRLLTAVNLNKDRQASILAKLEQQTSQKLALKFEVDPAILGGLVLQVGDKVLDASLRAQLNILRDIIKRGE